MSPFLIQPSGVDGLAPFGLCGTPGPGTGDPRPRRLTAASWLRAAATATVLTNLEVFPDLAAAWMSVRSCGFRRKAKTQSSSGGVSSVGFFPVMAAVFFFVVLGLLIASAPFRLGHALDPAGRRARGPARHLPRSRIRPDHGHFAGPGRSVSKRTVL